MKTLNVLILAALIMLFSGCSNKSDTNTATNPTDPPTNTTAVSLSGIAAKGPFVQNSLVKAYKLKPNGTIDDTIDAIETRTTDNKGTYTLPSIPWSGATLIEVHGKYYNEADANVSADPITLRAVVWIDTNNTATLNANIHPLTEIAATQALALMAQGQSAQQALLQAKEDVAQLFDLNLTGIDIEDLDITDGAGELASKNVEALRISAAFAQNPQLLDALKNGLQDGDIRSDQNETETINAVIQAIAEVNLTQVASNLATHLGEDSDVPNEEDVNEEPTYVQNPNQPFFVAPSPNNQAPIMVAENTTFATTLLAHDIDDPDGVNLNYLITGGADRDLFEIQPTNLSHMSQIVFKNAPDFENPTDSDQNNVYLVEVSVTDGAFYTTLPLEIHVTNQVETAPTLLADKTFSIDENATASTPIGSILSHAGDGNQLTFSLSGDGSDLFSIDSSGTIHLEGTLDYETQRSYTLQVQADNGLKSAQVSLTINVNNIPDVKHAVSNATINVSEATPTQTLIGNVAITPGDANLTTITTNPQGIVSVATDGKVTLVQALDYETAQSHTITLTAAHPAGNSTAILTLQVTNVNDNPPTFANATQAQYTVVENNTYVTDLNVSDIDGDNVTLAISGGADQALFELNGTTLQFKSAPTYQTGASNTYQVEINASDGTYQATHVATVTVVQASNVTLIDPYIENGVVWADINNDGNITDNELSLPSDQNGVATFKVQIPDTTTLRLIKLGLHNGKPYDGELSASYTQSRPIITPVTSLSAIGFSDTEIVSYLIANGLSAQNGYTQDINASEIYRDPFSTDLLPIDGNMSNFSDAQINTFRRALVANTAIHIALSLGDGYNLTKADIANNFFIDPDGSGPALSPLGFAISAATNILNVNFLKSVHARVAARIYVTGVEYVRDAILADANLSDPVSVNGVMNTALTYIQSTMIPSLINAYSTALAKGYQDPKFGWDNTGGLPIFYIRPYELGVSNVSFTLQNIQDQTALTLTLNTDHTTNTAGVTWSVQDGMVVLSNQTMYDLQGNQLIFYDANGTMSIYQVQGVSY